MNRIQKTFCLLTCSSLSVFFLSSAYAQTSDPNSEKAFWKCEQTDSKTGQYESVSLVPVGDILMKLVFTYRPGSDAPLNLPAVINETLVSDLHCKFYLAQGELVQCYSTNFTRYMSTERQETNPRNMKLVMKSDHLVWPDNYKGIKTNEDESFVIEMDKPGAFCGLVK